MKRTALQILLGLGGLLMFFRFGGPALIYGATGPGPFGDRWLTERGATLLLDADLRFFGAMMIGLGVIFLWAIARVEALGSVIYILACAVALGAGARIYARQVWLSRNRRDDTGRNRGHHSDLTCSASALRRER
jgi:hypothetical protein